MTKYCKLKLRTKDTDDNIETKTEKWLRRVYCHDSLLKKVMEGQMKGRKKPGRPREVLLDLLMKKTTKWIIHS